MKTHITNPRIRAGNLMVTALMCLMTIATLQAQDLIVHLGYTPPMDKKQQHYLRTVTENPINENVQFVEINMEALRGEELIFNPRPTEKYEVHKVERGKSTHSFTSWCGKISGYENGGGDVNMVRAGEELAGHFTVDHMIYAVTHIGDGLHVLYEVNASAPTAEDCYDHDHSAEGDKDKRPEITHPDYVNNLSEEKSTGDCKIRVLVGFTPEAEALYTSILTQINNLFNTANTAFDYGDVNFNIELANAYRVDYTSTGNNVVDLDLWRGTSDGFMDEVHALRGIWQADQCALITPTGGGRAYLDLAYQNQFSLTGTPNFTNYTFHHELGHNMLCTHDVVNTTQPGTIPYAGWGDPQGCFRTIMAYQAACGTESCPVANIYSRSIDTYNCGGIDRSIGNINFRNADRLFLSRSAVINHEVSPTNAVYAGNYTLTENEAVHMASNFTFTYSGIFGNLFTLQSGSEGSFRATDVVTLGEGFRANEGSFFEAYLNNCSSFDQSAKNLGDSEPHAEGHFHEQQLADQDKSILGTVKVYPNPFNEAVFVEIEVEDYEDVSITMTNVLGQPVKQALNKSALAPGKHQVEISTANLAGGVYLISVVTSGGERTVQRVVKNN